MSVSQVSSCRRLHVPPSLIRKQNEESHTRTHAHTHTYTRSGEGPFRREGGAHTDLGAVVHGVFAHAVLAADGGCHVIRRDLMAHDPVALHVGVALHVLGMVDGRFRPLELVQIKRVRASARFSAGYRFCGRWPAWVRRRERGSVSTCTIT